MKPLVLSGIRPTGQLHIGNYLGAVKNWLKLQETANCIFMVADYHGITTPFSPREMPKAILGVVMDYLAAGIDPKKSLLILQSQIPEHAELAWILGTITPVSWLERVPTYKEQITQHPDYVNLGLFSYPVLMAADILLYKTNLVPVGEDQLPHIELTREIAKRFNQMFGKTFPIPEVVLSQGERIMGLDKPDQKMSKSLGPKNYIALSDSPKLIWEKLSTAVTDPARKKRTDPGTPEKCNLFSLHKLFSSQKEIQTIKKQCPTAKIGCLECKKILAENISQEFAHFRERRQELAKNPQQVRDILDEHIDKARVLAYKTLDEVKRKLGLR